MNAQSQRSALIPSTNSEPSAAGGRLALLGVGQMGEALLAGALRDGAISPKAVTVTGLDPTTLERVGAHYGVRVTTDNALAVADAEVVFVAVKPRDVPAVLAEIRTSLRPGAVVVSVAAGIKIETLERLLAPGTPVVRAMPNTPALIGAGVTGVSPGSQVTAEHVAVVHDLLRGTGDVVEVPEEAQAALGAVSGSGPAYVCYLVDALIEAGVAQGLARELATRLAVGTFLGAARLLSETGQHPALAREAVTSPGGTTVVALQQLDAGAVRAAVGRAVAAAVTRTEELGG